VIGKAAAKVRWERYRELKAAGTLIVKPRKPRKKKREPVDEQNG